MQVEVPGRGDQPWIIDDRLQLAGLVIHHHDGGLATRAAPDREPDFIVPDTIVVDDRGYNDYRLFDDWTDSGGFFVTRMKGNAQFEVVEELEPPQNRNIVKDQIVRMAGAGAQEKCPHLLHRVEAIREDAGDILVFLTNHPGLGASTIAAIYKDRWQIELFFKALKQNLKIKTFVGTLANAAKTQIRTALIAMLLLRHLQLFSRFGWSLFNLVALLHMNLFTHRDLIAWLNQPFATPPDPQDVAVRRRGRYGRFYSATSTTPVISG